MLDISYEIKPQARKVELPDKLIFGRIFTPHIFEMEYDSALGGWHSARIKEFEDMRLSPAAMVLHYGQAIFEGLKAYKLENGKVAIFRPEKNIERMNRSARRLCMPEIEPEFFLKAMKELVALDKDWIPTKPGHALYIRPLMIATDPVLGVRPADNYKFMIMLSPVGPYYPEGFKPVPIMATDKYVRAVRHGVGDCKVAGNYAGSLLAQKEAMALGYTQVLWLDAIELKYIEEVGTMNIFVRFEDEVATPALTGSILPGVTRMSVLQILKEWGYNVNERKIAIDEVVERYKDGSLKEIFGAGTAAVIAAVSKLKYKDTILEFSSEEPGELAQKLYKEITDIQYGRIEDRYGWLTVVD
jgi:branched-chain amino acid aminotransferase